MNEHPGGERPPHRQRNIERPSLMAANAMYLLATVGIVLIPLLGSLALFLWPGQNTVMLQRNLSMLYEVLLLLLPVLLYKGRHPGTGPALRMRPASLKAMLIAAVSALVGLFLCNYLGTLWMIGIESLGGKLQDSGLSIGAGPWGVIAAILGIGVLPAICEELLFRGAILGAWEWRGTAKALCVSSVLFALLHGSVEGFPVHLLLGFVLGYLVITSGSVYVGMVYHFVHNAGSILLSLASQNSADQTLGSIYNQIGGMAGVAQLLLMVLISGAIYALLLVAASSERQQQGIPFAHRAEGPGMTAQELLVLISGIVTAGALLLVSVLRTMRIL